MMLDDVAAVLFLFYFVLFSLLCFAQPSPLPMAVTEKYVWNSFWRFLLNGSIWKCPGGGGGGAGGWSYNMSRLCSSCDQGLTRVPTFQLDVSMCLSVELGGVSLTKAARVEAEEWTRVRQAPCPRFLFELVLVLGDEVFSRGLHRRNMSLEQGTPATPLLLLGSRRRRMRRCFSLLLAVIINHVESSPTTPLLFLGSRRRMRRRLTPGPNNSPHFSST